MSQSQLDLPSGRRRKGWRPSRAALLAVETLALQRQLAIDAQREVIAKKNAEIARLKKQLAGLLCGPRG